MLACQLVTQSAPRTTLKGTTRTGGEHGSTSLRVAHSNLEVQMHSKSSSVGGGVNRAVMVAGALAFAALSVPLLAGSIIVSAVALGAGE